MKYKEGVLIMTLENRWVGPGIKGKIIKVDPSGRHFRYIVQLEDSRVLWLGDKHIRPYEPYLDQKE